MMPSERVLIVGTGHAAASAAVALRRAGYSGLIEMIGQEDEAPYQRPPLSKEYLSGAMSRRQLLLQPEAYWSERRIDIRLGTRVAEVDPLRLEVVTNTGERLGYNHLVWAAGGYARRLGCEGAELSGVHTLRSRADADLLRSQLADASRIVVIGGGYVGLEAAATLVSQGKEVILLEQQNRLLARVAAAELSEFYEGEHRRHGVDIRLNSSVAMMEGNQGHITAVRLDNHERLEADLAIVGIGLVPNVEALVSAGAAGGNGVAVDAQCRTSLPHIYAIGDCALHRNQYANDTHVRLESIQNAHDQAAVAAKAIVGSDGIYDSVPWFWSHQYDLKLQTVGLSMGFDDVVVRGDPDTRSFSVVYLRQGRVIALDCVNATRDYVQGKRLVEAGTMADRHELGDPAIALKQLVASS